MLNSKILDEFVPKFDVKVTKEAQQKHGILNEQMIESKVNSLLETPNIVFDQEKFIQLLGHIYPSLFENSQYWAPEIYWLKIKQCTGIDINEVMRIYKLYHQEEENKWEAYKLKKKTNLKRKFDKLVYSASKKKRFI